MREIIRMTLPQRSLLENSARQLAAVHAPRVTFDLTGVRLGPPVPDPDKIICLGLNYMDHAKEVNLQAPELLCCSRNTAIRW